MESYGTKLARLFSKHSLHLEAIAYPTARHTCDTSVSCAFRWPHWGMSQQVAITMIMQQRHFEVSHAGVRLLHMSRSLRHPTLRCWVPWRCCQQTWNSRKGLQRRWCGYSSKDKEYYDLHQTSKGTKRAALFQHAESVRRYITIDVQIFTSYKYAQIEYAFLRITQHSHSFVLVHRARYHHRGQTAFFQPPASLKGKFAVSNCDDSLVNINEIGAIDPCNGARRPQIGVRPFPARRALFGPFERQREMLRRIPYNHPSRGCRESTIRGDSRDARGTCGRILDRATLMASRSDSSSTQVPLLTTRTLTATSRRRWGRWRDEVCASPTRHRFCQTFSRKGLLGAKVAELAGGFPNRT
ncbi:hypothetical protein KCU82_g10, partial [Aureobasidium melanogenum]